MRVFIDQAALSDAVEQRAHLGVVVGQYVPSRQQLYVLALIRSPSPTDDDLIQGHLEQLSSSMLCGGVSVLGLYTSDYSEMDARQLLSFADVNAARSPCILLQLSSGTDDDGEGPSVTSYDSSDWSIPGKRIPSRSISIEKALIKSHFRTVQCRLPVCIRGDHVDDMAVSLREELTERCLIEVGEDGSAVVYHSYPSLLSCGKSGSMTISGGIASQTLVHQSLPTTSIVDLIIEDMVRSFQCLADPEMAGCRRVFYTDVFCDHQCSELDCIESAQLMLGVKEKERVHMDTSAYGPFLKQQQDEENDASVTNIKTMCTTGGDSSAEQQQHTDASRSATATKSTAASRKMQVPLVFSVVLALVAMLIYSFLQY